DAAPAFFDCESVEALAPYVYAKPLTKGEIAAFATETAKLAESGDAVARELGAQIAAVIRRCALDGASNQELEFPVGLIGSAVKAGPMFVDPLTRAIHEVAPAARTPSVH